VKGRPYPFLGGCGTQTVGCPVNAAGEHERAEVVGSRLDVVAVDAHAGRAKEAESFGFVCRGDRYEPQIELNSSLVGHTLNKLVRRLVIRAALEVQKLNVLRGHGWRVALPAILGP
jgi:hypothetical protein